MQDKPTASLGFLSIHPCKTPRETHESRMVKDHVKTPVNSLEEVAYFMLNKSWSSAIWRNGHAKNEHFIESIGIPLDIDKGISLDEAMWFIEPFDHVICTTKSHQKWKNGDPPRDRYRVYLPTHGAITTEAEFRATVGYWVSLLGGDTNGIAPAMHYKPANEIYSIKSTGHRITIELPPPPRKIVKEHFSGGKICEVMAHNFMMNYHQYDGRQKASYISAMRLKEGGRSKDFAIQFIKSRTDLSINEVQHAVESAYKG